MILEKWILALQQDEVIGDIRSIFFFLEKSEKYPIRMIWREKSEVKR